MNTVDTPVTRTASGATRKNARNGGRCPRCHRFGVFTPDSIVCDRCASTRPSILTVTITVTLAVVGGGR
jgi:hypothetical protein